MRISIYEGRVLHYIQKFPKLVGSRVRKGSGVWRGAAFLSLLPAGFVQHHVHQQGTELSALEDCPPRERVQQVTNHRTRAQIWGANRLGNSSQRPCRHGSLSNRRKRLENAPRYHAQPLRYPGSSPRSEMIQAVPTRCSPQLLVVTARSDAGPGEHHSSTRGGS